MLNRSESFVMSTSVLKALPGKLDIERHSHNILYVNVQADLNFRWVHTHLVVVSRRGSVLLNIRTHYDLTKRALTRMIKT